jgi:hypothetical protein
MPLERAIGEYRFAYSAQAAAAKMLPPVPVGNLILLATDVESGDAPAYARNLQPDLVGADRKVLVAGLAGSRNPGPSASAQRVAAKISHTADLRDAGPSGIHQLVLFGSEGAGRLGDREAGDRD